MGDALPRDEPHGADTDVVAEGACRLPVVAAEAEAVDRQSVVEAEGAVYTRQDNPDKWADRKSRTWARRTTGHRIRAIHTNLGASRRYAILRHASRRPNHVVPTQV